MATMTNVDAAVERVMHEDKETVLAIMDFQRHGADFYWHEHDGSDKPGLCGATQTGMIYGGRLDKGWTGEKRKELNEWYERIETHFRRVIAASGLHPQPGQSFEYPNQFADQ